MNNWILKICLLKQDGIFWYKMAEHLHILAEIVGHMAECY
jgi:hypothetical protein